MRRTLLSWPVRALVLVVSAIWVSGVACAQPTSWQDRQAGDIASTEQEWIPAGSVPIPPKPKVTTWVDDSTAIPVGGLIIPPKPKAREDGETGADGYPTGAPVIPPKPKLASSIQY